MFNVLTISIIVCRWNFRMIKLMKLKPKDETNRLCNTITRIIHIKAGTSVKRVSSSSYSVLSDSNIGCHCMIQSLVICQSNNVHATSVKAFVYPTEKCLSLSSSISLSFYFSCYHLVFDACLPQYMSKKLNCLFTICFINCRSIWTLLNTFSFVIFFV